MGTMKLIASNGQEVKQIKFPKITAEEIQEMVKQIKAHENDEKLKNLKFYDYVGCIGPIKPIPQSVADQYEEIASKYGKKIEGINYDKCCTG